MNTKLGFFLGGGGSVNAFLVLLVSYFWNQKYVEKFRKRKLGSRCSSYGFEE